VLEDASRLFKTPSHDLLSAPLFPLYLTSPTHKLRAVFFWKASGCCKPFPFMAPIKLPLFSFCHEEKKSSFYSTIFIIQKKSRRKTISSHKKAPFYLLPPLLLLKQEEECDWMPWSYFIK
jgi:hypothetical protein